MRNTEAVQGQSDIESPTQTDECSSFDFSETEDKTNKSLGICHVYRRHLVR